MKRKNASRSLSRRDDYEGVLAGVIELLEAARRVSARAVNTVITTTYWEIGRRIVESEMRGKDRADYGKRLIDRLSADLTRRFGRGFSRRAVYQMRGFFLAYPPIVQSSSAQSAGRAHFRIMQSPIAQSPMVTPRFPLPWAHYVRLLSVENHLARKFYETEALRGGWTVKQLHRQIDSQFYERTALSRHKVAMLTKHNRRKPADRVTAEEEIKDPFVLEFLGLKDEYSESQIEEALIRHLESFLLELGGDFAFIARQRRLRVGDTWYRIDLLFFHRRLRCLILIDLKTGKFTHADAGQMHLYCNYAAEHWTNADENPPVGLILCADKDNAVAHYALEGLPNKVLAAKYKTTLPDERLLAAEVEKTRYILQARGIDHSTSTPADYKGDQ
jgi:predicted nuclease of restriction endonuclease-like (RecB) superfamily